MADRKKKVLIQTDSVLAMTGFGKAARLLIEYLYKTGKYDIVHFAVGSVVSIEHDRFPWKTIASVNPQQLDAIKKQNDPKNWEGIERMAGYGAFALDHAINEEKPDVFIGIQDIWGIDFSVDKPWYNGITSALWTTLDSLPILPKAVDLAPKVKNYWSWANFATEALHKIGHKHVRTVRGPVDTTNFFRLDDQKRIQLRQRAGISPDTFIVGFVFRNQLRKSVPNMLQGFKAFQNDNPTTKTKLLLHTCWAEGWDIKKLLEEHKIDNKDILTTYICKTCRNYQVKNFDGHELDCPYCKAKKQQVTTHPTIGVTEAGLNEVYNLMDVYCHPFTSGGQEIPVQEAKLTELVTLVTNYSCGEDLCAPEANSLPLSWAEYREPGSQFIKASTFPSSIGKQLTRVLKMKDTQRREMGRKARQWVIDNFSIDVIGKSIAEFLDAAPLTTYDFSAKMPAKDPNYNMPQIQDNGEWVLHMYHNILKMAEVDNKNSGYEHWMTKLAEGMPRPQIEQYFRQVAFQENQKNGVNQVPFENFLNKDDKGRVLFCVKESAGDILLCSSLFKSVRERYPDYALYVATKPEYKDLILGNPYVTKWLEWNPMMENLIWAEGNSQHNGFFDICYLPTLGTQNALDYLHNGKDKLDLQLT